MSSFTKSSSEGMEQDAPVNIASIIDCFTVLITYILAAASFLSLGVVDAGIVGNASADAAVVDVAPTTLHVHVGEGLNLTFSSPSFDGAAQTHFTVDQATGEVKTFATQHPNLKAVTLSAEDSVPYSDLIKVVATLRDAKMPVVFSGKPI